MASSKDYLQFVLEQLSEFIRNVLTESTMHTPDELAMPEEDHSPCRPRAASQGQKKRPPRK